MPTFTKYKPKTEKELHEIIHREIEELEEGLQVLKYEFATSKGERQISYAPTVGKDLQLLRSN